MKKIIIVLVIVLAVAGGIYYWKNQSTTLPNSTVTTNSVSSSGATPESIKAITQYQYTEKYTHPINKFSFNYPKDFTVSSVPNEAGETIIVQNITTKVAVQINVSPFQGDDIDITPDVIKTDIPDMKIDTPQELLVGSSRKGLAFVSDNPAFGGKSREVWFVFKGNLYQISTYYEFDDFLKGVFATWKFE